MSTAERNRAIKKVLSAEFGAGKVTVRGSRGTAYGWVRVVIAVAPKDRDDLQNKTARVWELFNVNGITIGTYGYDDPGSDYGYGSKIQIDFDQCQDVFNEGEQVIACNGKRGTIKRRDYTAGGDWYVIELADGGTDQYYKKDLARISMVAA